MTREELVQMGTVQLVRRGPNGGQAPELPRGQAQEALASDVGEQLSKPGAIGPGG